MKFRGNVILKINQRSSLNQIQDEKIGIFYSESPLHLFKMSLLLFNFQKIFLTSYSKHCFMDQVKKERLKRSRKKNERPEICKKKFWGDTWNSTRESYQEIVDKLDKQEKKKKIRISLLFMFLTNFQPAVCNTRKPSSVNVQFCLFFPIVVKTKGIHFFYNKDKF